ncbi:hypothetical protein [Mycobacterium sp.]|uniref:hypothetical protein n=1 Tax=Mycobacterium sp. TaxID=1785 RepID=UPI002C01B434|nr:hypothetical protein [Mycobacterium sp.]HTQ18294.1 hypothetical protein [Mycobacterium sp.]
MHHHLAYFSSSSSGGWDWFSVLLTVVIIAVIIGPFIVRRMRQIRGPVLTGTAQVLSLRQFGSGAVNGPPRQICRFRLRVEIPGQEPYEVAHWQNVGAWELAAVAPGETVAVEVDATNPKKVRIGGRSTRRHVGPGGSTHTVFTAPPKVVFQQSTTQSDPIDIADLLKQSPGAGPVISAADLLGSGQRAPGVLKSFSATGTTPRSLGRTPSRPEFLDAPHYVLEVELQFPNLAPLTGRSIQPVPLSQVPNLAIGLKLACAVDPADPVHRFVVDWPGV